MSADLVTFAYAFGVVTYGAFVAHLLWKREHGRRKEPVAIAFIAAVSASCAWSAVKVYDEMVGLPTLPFVATNLDLLRYALWFLFLTLLLRHHPTNVDGPGRRANTPLLIAAALVGLAFAASLIVVFDSGGLAERLRIGAWLAMAVYGLVLLEQLFRNQPEQARWNAKPVCLALACVYGYDLYLFAEAMLFGRFDRDALNVRGAVHALAVPFLFIASRRHPTWIDKLQVSRSAAFYSASLILVGAYLLFIAAVGYYVRFFGGSWGRALEVALLFAALVLLAGLLLSGSLRARLRVFLGKNFFSYRYDYRQEWLRFTEMLSTGGSPQDIGMLVIRGLANMLECTGGSLWTRGWESGQFVQSAQWNAARFAETEPESTAFCAFMREREWIIDIEEYRATPRKYGQLVMPRWLLADASAWVVVPLIVADDMMGFVVLSRPRTTIDLNWEVRDLLKTAGRQAAGVLSRMHATEALLEARKFEAFNRMSAFVVHDLKNIITQQSLMLKNAERLRDNPEFQQDMLLTVESSLEKMRQMMLQLREGEKPPGGVSGVNLEAAIREIEQSVRRHGRSLEVEIVDKVSTRGHDQRIARVLGHVVQNALDATPSSGRVWIRLRQSSGRAEVLVGDTGVGMTPEFVQTRLFRPFNTTKQSGMGIGSYESFQYIRQLGGSIDVQSEPGRGTVVTILLPLFDARKGSDLQLMGAS